MGTCSRALLVGLVCLVVFGKLVSCGGTRHSADQRLMHEHVIGSRDKPVKREELGFSYMSKRRVPNGPDPIHNRRAGNSGRPPGQV